MFLERLDDLLNFFCKPKWKTFNIVIGGDVNSAFDETREKQQSVAEIRNLLRQYNFICTNFSATRGSACLDDVFTNVDRDHFRCEVIPFPFSDHDALVVDLCNVRLA